MQFNYLRNAYNLIQKFYSRNSLFKQFYIYYFIY